MGLPLLGDSGEGPLSALENRAWEHKRAGQEAGRGSETHQNTDTLGKNGHLPDLARPPKDMAVYVRFTHGWARAASSMLQSVPTCGLSPCPGHVLKFTGNNLHRFLQDGLRQAWGMRDDAVLKPLQATKAELEKCKCLLPPPGLL